MLGNVLPSWDAISFSRKKLPNGSVCVAWIIQYSPNRVITAHEWWIGRNEQGIDHDLLSLSEVRCELYVRTALVCPRSISAFRKFLRVIPNICPNINNGWMFVIMVRCIFCDIWTEFLSIIYMKFILWSVRSLSQYFSWVTGENWKPQTKITSVWVRTIVLELSFSYSALIIITLGNCFLV